MRRRSAEEAPRSYGSLAIDLQAGNNKAKLTNHRNAKCVGLVAALILLGSQVRHKFQNRICMNDQNENENKDFAISQAKNRRRFISYMSSEWEQLWLDNVAEWGRDPPTGNICGNIQGPAQQMFLYRFLSETCTAKVETSPWCYVNDAYKPYWYNTVTHQFSLNYPGQDDRVAPIHYYENVTLGVVPDFNPENDKIFSRFTFYDEVEKKKYAEYIEPLVSHLRHPLAGCVNASHFVEPWSHETDRLLVFARSYLLWLPKPFSSKESEYYYFDAGASSWTSGAGGASLSVLISQFGKNNIHFDHVEAWEGTNPEATFYKDVPNEYRERVQYHQAWVSSNPNSTDPAKPFIPNVIANITKTDDYVFFKLDIDSLGIETGVVDFYLSNEGIDHVQHVDEFAWEHHVRGNYIMARRGWCPGACDRSKSLKQSYEYFLSLRKKGIRAHSWV